MIKKLFAVMLVFLVMLSCFSITSLASDNYLHDYLGELSEDEAGRISSVLREINKGEQSELHVVISSRASDAAQQYTSNHNVMILFIEYDYSFNEYYYELFTYGVPTTNISDGEVNLILDNPSVYNNIKRGKIYEGLSAALPLIDKANEGRLRSDGYVGRVVLVSAIIGACVAGIVVAVIVRKYKKKLKSPIYPIDKYAKMELDTAFCYDRFLYKNVTRIRVNNSSSGGHSRGGSSRGGSRGRR